MSDVSHYSTHLENIANYQNKQLWLACVIYGKVLNLQVSVLTSISVHLTHRPSENSNDLAISPYNHNIKIRSTKYRAENKNKIHVIFSASQVCAAFACQVRERDEAWLTELGRQCYDVCFNFQSKSGSCLLPSHNSYILSTYPFSKRLQKVGHETFADR